MNRIGRGVLLLLFLVLVPSLFGGEFRFLNEVDRHWIDSLAEVGFDLAYREEYDRADSVFDLIACSYPEQPHAYLFRTALLDLYMLDFSVDDREDEFFRAVDECLGRADDWLKALKKHRSWDDNQRGWAHFFKGGALSYKAMRLGRKRSFFRAVSTAVSALKELNHALNADSTVYDAYLGLGTYDFLMSELPKFVKWLPFIGDNRDRGIRRIRTAAEKGRYTRIAARDALAWMLAYAVRTDEALQVMEELVSEFPDSRTFKWTQAFVYRRAGRWREVEETYDALYESVRVEQADYPYAVAITLYWVAKSRYMMGRREEAIRYMEMAETELAKETRRNHDIDKLHDDLEAMEKRWKK
jgi:tetratricopeptide (TPR) repeat protein